MMMHTLNWIGGALAAASHVANVLAVGFLLLAAGFRALADKCFAWADARIAPPPRCATEWWGI